MHHESFELMKEFSHIAINEYGADLSVLDVGSMNVNGTYRSLWSGEYTGVDLDAGPNVDHVITESDWSSLDGQEFDVVICGQVLEHTARPGLLYENIFRHTKPGGTVCIIAPSSGPEHRYPIDFARYYPDAHRHFAAEAGFFVESVTWGHAGQWHDIRSILKKPSTLEVEFERRCHIPSDINEHLETLRSLAAECSHVTEFGIRQGNSTVALILGAQERYVGYDINQIPELIMNLSEKAAFIQANTVEMDPIAETDLLFIDSLHTYEQLKTELAIHGGKVRKFIALHDTISFGEVGEDGKKPGLMAAIDEFTDGGNWEILGHDVRNNGLMILGKMKQYEQADNHN